MGKVSEKSCSIEKIKGHVICSVTFFRKWCHLRDNVEKCGRARYAAEDTAVWSRKGAICLLDN